jgi:hypothetical protein
LAFCVSCSKPTDASKENFAKAIDSYLQSRDDNERVLEAPCWPLRERTDLPIAEVEGSWAAFRRYLNAMTAAGLLTKQRVKNTYSEYNEKTGDVDRYVLTTLGKRFSKTKFHAEWGNDGMNTIVFTYGHIKFKNILLFTVPTNGNGVVMSNVQFVYTVEVENWARQPDLNAEDTRLERDVASQNKPYVSTARMFLTNDGWMVNSIDP